MDWQSIEAFLAVADELHFGHAADRLGLSQARVSQLVKKLERQVGITLFDRTTRRVSLTPAGQQLLADLAPAHRALLDGITRARAAARGVTGQLNVGFYGPLAGRVILDALKTLKRSHPELEVTIHETEVADPCRPLRDAEVDVLLTQLPVTEPGITTGPVIFTEPQVLAVSARHPLARRTSLSVEDLASYRTFLPAGTPPPQWLDTYLPWTTPTGRPIERGPAVRTFQELLALVAADQGVCPVGEHNIRYHARPDIAYVPLSDAPPLAFGFAWRSNAETAKIQLLTTATSSRTGRVPRGRRSPAGAAGRELGDPAAE